MYIETDQYYVLCMLSRGYLLYVYKVDNTWSHVLQNTKVPRKSRDFYKILFM